MTHRVDCLHLLTAHNIMLLKQFHRFKLRARNVCQRNFFHIIRFRCDRSDFGMDPYICILFFFLSHYNNVAFYIFYKLNFTTVMLIGHQLKNIWFSFYFPSFYHTQSNLLFYTIRDNEQIN